MDSAYSINASLYLILTLKVSSPPHASHLLTSSCLPDETLPIPLFLSRGSDLIRFIFLPDCEVLEGREGPESQSSLYLRIWDSTQHLEDLNKDVLGERIKKGDRRRLDDK